MERITRSRPPVRSEGLEHPITQPRFMTLQDLADYELAVAALPDLPVELTRVGDSSSTVVSDRGIFRSDSDHIIIAIRALPTDLDVLDQMVRGQREARENPQGQVISAD